MINKFYDSHQIDSNWPTLESGLSMFSFSYISNSNKCCFQLDFKITSTTLRGLRLPWTSWSPLVSSYFLNFSSLPTGGDLKLVKRPDLSVALLSITADNMWAKISICPLWSSQCEPLLSFWEKLFLSFNPGLKSRVCFVKLVDLRKIKKVETKNSNKRTIWSDCKKVCRVSLATEWPLTAEAERGVSSAGGGRGEGGWGAKANIVVQFFTPSQIFSDMQQQVL